MLQCYVLTFGRSVTAFSAPPRSQRPGQMPRSPHPKAGHVYCTGPLCAASFLVPSVNSRGFHAARAWIPLQSPEPLECGASLLVKEKSSGEKMADKIPPWIRLPRNSKGSLTCRKSATRDPRLYFPSEGRHAEDFYARKNPAGFEPANSGTRGQHANH
jgi:hypothetical protein